MSIKMDELKKRLDELKNLEVRLQNGYLQQGYICGLINGLRIARGVISGEDYILEREEVQERSDSISRVVVPKTDLDGTAKGFVVLTFDKQGALLKLDQV